MHILIAPDSFKECLSADQVARALAKGFQDIYGSELSVDLLPLADGGEGTLDALHAAGYGALQTAPCVDPLGRPHQGRYLLQGERAVIELAEASGLALLTDAEKNPGVTTTRGTGDLMLHAVSQGARELIVTLGGSATNDAACGIARAFGYRLLDSEGNELPEGGLALRTLAHIDSSACHPQLQELRVRVACDVHNPLCGSDGASQVYAPQKGADETMVTLLEEAMQVLVRHTDRCQAEVPGVGAAGGSGFGLSYFFSAVLEPGFDLIADAVQLESYVQNADLILTAEGECNFQTVSGKVPQGVARYAEAHQVPVLLFAGALGTGWEKVLSSGITSVIPIAPGPITLKDSIEQAEVLLSAAAFRTASLIQRMIQ